MIRELPMFHDVGKKWKGITTLFDMRMPFSCLKPYIQRMFDLFHDPVQGLPRIYADNPFRKAAV
ncbi:hypothetical protein D3C76_1847030 [compost metagenome]